MQMRVNTSTDGRFINELTRRQHIFSNFMESFNTGIALPPIMVSYGRRIKALETAVKKAPETPIVDKKPADVDSLIETVDEPLIKECPHRARMEATIKELGERITKLNGIVDDKNKEIAKLGASIIQLNASLEDTIKRVHELSKQVQERSTVSTEPASVEQKEISVDTSSFATKEELKATEKRIVKELTDKLDAEMIDAEERFDEKIKASIEPIKLALDETIGGEEEDGEEDEEEEDLDGVIDMDWARASIVKTDPLNDYDYNRSV